VKIILHIGMPKTGTSSIQSTFYHLRAADPIFLPIEGPNHGPMYILLFEDEDRLESFLRFQLTGLKKDALLQRRHDVQAKLDNWFSDNRPARVMISGERMSSPGDAHILSRFAAYLNRIGGDVEVIGYVRPPMSYIQSAYQQRLKGRPDLHTRFEGPRYRDRFEKFDDIFGRGKVTLKPFTRDRLYQGDVVLDIAHEIGVSLNPDQIRRSNESLSAAAVAFLYLQRIKGNGLASNYPAAGQDNLKFIALLNQMSGPALTLSRGLIEQHIPYPVEDIQWMEERLGCPIDDSRRDNEAGLRREDELEGIALRNQSALEDLAWRRLGLKFGLSDNTSVAVLADALERVRQAVKPFRMSDLTALDV